MSQSFNQQAYQFHTVYQPENFCNARQWYGQPQQPFVAAEQFTVPKNHGGNNPNSQGNDNEEEVGEDASSDDEDEVGDQTYAAALAEAAGVATTYAPAESEDSSESENDDPATRVAKQLLRKGRPRSSSTKTSGTSSKTPARHDFKKSKVRVRIREAKERFENAQHAVQEAERAYQNAQQTLQDRENEWKKLNEELVDELLEAEKMRPWNKVYFQLVEYREKHGHIALAARAATNKRRREQPACEQESHEEYLGGWIMRQRGDRNKGKLDEWKILALNRLGFVWDGLESMWQNTYQKVKRFYNEHGHINITTKQDMPLNRWLKTQRYTYKEYKNSGFTEPGKFGCKMNRERKELLDALGMDWGDEDQDDSWWIQPFNQLRQIQQKQGHLRTLPTEETLLLEFVKRQRDAYQKFLANRCKDSFEMTAERVSLLESIGFPWTGTTTPFVEGAQGDSPSKKKRTKKAAKDTVVISHYNPWMTQYNKVKGFAQKHGHLRYIEEETEPREEVEKMEKWDSLQRKFQEVTSKKKYLTPERLELLNQIKFFQPKHELEFWFRLSQLRKFRARHGHCMIMFDYPGAPKSYQELADWATQQRKEFRKLRNGSSSTITDEKAALMMGLGFNFNLERPTAVAATAGRAAAIPAAEGILAIAKAPPKKQPATGTAQKPPSKQSTGASPKTSPTKGAAKSPSEEATTKRTPDEEPLKKRKRGRPRKNT